MEFRRARIDNFEKIAELYKYVIDNTEHFDTKEEIIAVHILIDFIYYEYKV